MKEREIWENTWKIIGYEESAPDKEVINLIPILKKSKCKKILDLGCGSGRHMLYMGKKGFFMVGLDISSTALNLTEKLLKKEKLKNYSLVKHDMIKLPFLGESFDAVISVNVVHHNTLNKIEKTVNEIRRVLKTGGITLIIVPSTKDRKFGIGRKIEHNTYLTPHSETVVEKEDTVHHFFDENEIRKLFSRFKIIKINEEIEIINTNEKIKKIVHWTILCKK